MTMCKMPRYLKLLALIFCFPTILIGCADKPKYADPRASVHLIEVNGGTGSGVMVAPFLMLTAAHVAGDGQNITVGPKKLPAKLMHKDDKADIALLHVAIDCPCAPFAAPPAADEPVVVIGYPVNQHVHIQIATEGLIQGIWENRLQLTAAAAGGNSGGGVFVLQNGQWRLAGILVEVMGWCVGFGNCYPAMHLSRAVDTQTMLDFLAQAEGA